MRVGLLVLQDKVKVGKRIKRTGRSENNSLVFITQSVKDKADDDGGNFGCHFAFDEKMNVRIF